MQRIIIRAYFIPIGRAAFDPDLGKVDVIPDVAAWD
jgi:hypothetical protein